MIAFHIKRLATTLLICTTCTLLTSTSFAQTPSENAHEPLAKQYHHRIIAKIAEPPYTQEDVETEITFGRELAAKILGKYPPLKNDKINRYVNEVGQLLARHSKRPELTYHFVVLDTPIINAFSTLGGYVFITKGALSYVQDEAELAAILAHEIGHVELRHYVKKVGLRSQKGDKESGLTAILSGGGAAAVTAFNQALDETLEILFTKGLQSKQDEFEADQYATLLLAETGYDPTALERYFQRIAKIKTQDTQILTQTHPPLKERIDHLEKMITNNQLKSDKFAKLEDRLHANIQ